jgi:hypothetical protein
MSDETIIEWKTLINKYVRIKEMGKFNLPREVTSLVPQLIVPFNVLVLDADDNNVKLRHEGNKGELHCKILKNGVLKEQDEWFSILKYKFLRELTKWEILEFEVADYIGGFYDESEIDFDSKIRTKLKSECEYMQKSANFKLEQYYPIKGLALFLFGLILSSKIDLRAKPSDPLLFLLPLDWISSLTMMLFLLLIFVIYLGYLKYRRRYQELILMLEARILSNY